jgi:hypothetical protein
MEQRPNRYRPQPEQATPRQERGERQPLPNVWEVLERDVRLTAPDFEDRPRSGSQEFWREVHEVNRLRGELKENGTPRDNLLLNLFQWIGMTSPYRTYSAERAIPRHKLYPVAEKGFSALVGPPANFGYLPEPVLSRQF